MSLPIFNPVTLRRNKHKNTLYIASNINKTTNPVKISNLISENSEIKIHFIVKFRRSLGITKMAFSLLHQKYIVKYNEQGKALIYIGYDPSTLMWNFSNDDYFKKFYESAVNKFEKDVEIIRDSALNKLELERNFRERALQLLDLFFLVEKDWPVFGIPSYFLKPDGNVDFEFIECVNDLSDFDPEFNTPVQLEFEENRRAIQTLLKLAQNFDFCCIEKIELIQHNKETFQQKLGDPILIHKFLNSVNSNSICYEIYDQYSENILMAFDTEGSPLFAVVKEYST